MAQSVWIGWLGPLQFQSDASGIVFPGTVSATRFLGDDGTAALPTFGFSGTGDGDNGLYLSAADTVGVSAGGTLRLSVSASAVTSTVPVVIGTGVGSSAVINAGGAGIGGIALLETASPASVTDETYVAGFGYGSTGVGRKTWSLSGVMADTTHATGYSAVRLNAAYQSAGTQLDDVFFVGWGAHGAAFFPLNELAATAPGANVLRVFGSLALGSGNLASAGAMRLANSAVVTARNAANGADIQLLGTNGSNMVELGDGTADTGGLRINTTALAANSAIPVASKAWINTAPTIASGFGTSPSIPASNGTAAFTINVGTGGVASSGVLTMPAAATGWVVDCVDITNAASFVTVQTAGTTTSVTLTNYSRTTGLAIAWTASDVLRCKATAY